VRDVLEAYAPQGAADGAPRRPYVEYIRWLAAQDAERAARHWRALLGDWSEPTPLPAGTGAADAGPGGRAIQAHALGVEATAALVAHARRQHVTLNTLVQGAWALLLARHSRREEVLFGVTISGRPPDLPGVETMLGLFINTLPLRVDVRDAPLSEWLARLQQQLVELQQFEASPLYEVQRAAALAPGAPLFESLVVFENYPVEVREPVSAAGLSIEDAVDVSHANYPLALVAQPGRQLALQLRYDTGPLRRTGDPPAAAAAGAAARGPGIGARGRGSRSCHRSRRTSVAGSSRPGTTPRGRTRGKATVPQLFEEQVARAPGAPAVGRRRRHADLCRARPARQPAGLGAAAPRDRAGARSWRSSSSAAPTSSAGLLGILKAGCAYVPLDPEHPPRRIDVLLQDSGASALIARGAPAGGRAGFAGPVIDVEALPAAPAGEDDRAGPPRTLAAGDLAYVIYTSGSTGQPKGVCIPHRGITRLVLGTDFVQLQPADRVACASNVAFDAATFEIWGALLNGACSVCIDKDTALSPERFAAVLREQRVTTLFVTTALFNQLVQAVPDVFATLKHLLFGGEAVDPRRVRAVLERGRPARLLHVYGPTECTTYSTWHEVLEVPEDATTVPIGRPIANSTAYVLDPGLGPTPVGAPGELFLGGDGLALGYHRRPALTAERFVPHPFRPGERLYRTGDLVRQRADGALEFVGRTDTQVKLRGFRIEPGEVEESLRRQSGVAEVIVLCREDSPGERELVAYVVAAPGASLGRDALRAALAAELPEPMVPAAIVILPELPLTPNGKVDRRALPAPTGRRVDRAFAPPTGATEQRIAAIWRDVLGVSLVGSRDNFFDLGGHSLKLLAVHRRLAAELDARLAVTELFQHTTVEALARRIDGDRAEDEPAAPAAGIAPRAAPSRRPADGERSIAIVGMAGRFPGASDVEAFWRNLCDGVESITTFGAEELRRAGVPDELIGDSRYVPRRAVLDEPDRFDARFFGYTPREAELMDPQQRLFLECAWEALERAGYDPARHERPVGVFAGASVNSYLDVLRTRPELLAAAGGMAALIASISDFLTTRVSYKLDLHGPSMNVQTACSTSLVAVHEACRSLLDGGCDMALAGGVSVTVPWVSGYLHEASGVRSPDGHCRTFDARAEGMVSGNGVALVVLKRLADAVTDGDTIHAVIRGTAINNDGARKIGFTAPSIDGQAEVVARAQEQAGVEPGSIGYVECHGTATALGDPIEVAALTRVFRRGTAATGFCALASLKSNMGHLDAAAGVAGLIKAALAVERGVIPPSLHYVAPNPEIDFARSPFFVAARRIEWTPADGAPRRAGVSAFGIGGTNAHAVLEQPPAPAASGPSRPWQLLQLSARSEAALEAAGERLTRHLEREPGLGLADVAHTRCASAATTSSTAAPCSAPTRRARWRPCAASSPSGVGRGARRTASARSPSCSRVRARSTPAWRTGCTAASRSSARRSTAAWRSCARRSLSTCGPRCSRGTPIAPAPTRG
jgi:amino acid adenylation domain-containing protein